MNYLVSGNFVSNTADEVPGKTCIPKYMSKVDDGRIINKSLKISIRIRKTKKNRQHNGQKKKYKRTNNDLQNIHIELEIE
jgi:hypothetical protein